MTDLEVRDAYRQEVIQTLPMRSRDECFALLEKMQRDRTLHQAMNVASLPGIYKFSIVLPDGHERARA